MVANDCSAKQIRDKTFNWWAHGIRPRDMIYFAFPFGAFMAFWSAYRSAAALGARIISPVEAATGQRVKQIVEMEPKGWVYRNHL